MDILKRLREVKLHTAELLVLGFAALIIVGSILLVLPFASKSGESVGYINALFTAASAVCVTGLVVVDTMSHWTTFGHIVILILIQIGGLGFIVMGTMFALLIGRKINFRQRVIMKESMNKISVSGVVRLAKYVLIMTFSIEGVGALLLSFRFIPIYGFVKGVWYSIFHSISAFCNAGFDLIGNFQSLTPFVSDPIISLVVVTLIILGGLGFVVILEMIDKRNFKKFSLHTKITLTMTAVLLLSGFVIVMALEWNNPNTMAELSTGSKFLSGIFHAVTPRTAGFNTLPMNELLYGTLLMTIVFMFIGGSSAGTAGGAKVTTVGVLVFTITSVLRGKQDTEAFKRKIPRELVNRALTIIGLSITLVILVTFILSITESATFLEVFFEAVSAFGTVGLSMGITSSLSTVGKIVITLTMFFGRLGPLTVFMALAERRQVSSAISYPDEEIMIG